MKFIFALLSLLFVLLAFSTVNGYSAQELGLEDFVLDYEDFHSTEGADIEGFWDVITDPFTNLCPLSGWGIADKEAAVRSKFAPNYKQDAAAAFFSANEYNVGVDKLLPGYSLVKTFQVNSARISLHVNPSEKLLIASAQGTKGDWTSVNFEFQLVTNSFGPGKVHSGFLNEVSSIVNFNNKEFLTRVKTYLDQGYIVICTGQSQGAAESVLYAQAIYQAYPSKLSQLRIVNFGAPRTGNIDFANGVLVDAVRYAADSDPVTKVPTNINCYQHVGERRVVACQYSGVEGVFCHYPDIYFDDVNNRQATPYAVKGITIANDFNYDKSYPALAASYLK